MKARAINNPKLKWFAVVQGDTAYAVDAYQHEVDAYWKEFGNHNHGLFRTYEEAFAAAMRVLQLQAGIKT